MAFILCERKMVFGKMRDTKVRSGARVFETREEGEAFVAGQYKDWGGESRFCLGVATWQEREHWRNEEVLRDANGRIIFAPEGNAQYIRKRPLWEREAFWNHHSNANIHRHHYAHVSQVDPTMIAFTEDEKKGEADIQTRMKPGRYLRRYFGHALSDKQIAFYAEWWVAGEKPMRKGVELKLATTPDEIEHVYRNGPDSCMSGSLGVPEGMHPARTYGAGDLAVAYAMEGPKIIARALCWPEKKILGRVYPDIRQDDGRELLSLMRAAGYQHVNEMTEGFAAFNGAKMLKLKKREVRHTDYALPYLDGQAVNIEGDYFVMSHRTGQYSGGTNGYVRIEEVA